MENYKFNFDQHFDIDEDGIFVADPSIKGNVYADDLKAFSLILDTIGTNSSKVILMKL